MAVTTQSRTRFAVPVELAHGSVIRQRIRGLLEATQFPAEVVDDVVLAVGEAFANAVVHGSGTQFEQVDVVVWARQRSVSIELRYPGEPFDVAAPPVPELDQLTGRGRFLMRALMDAVQYDFLPGETVVRLEKQLALR
jgi:anti-sigma regulatory factor (Ser/Thr protein kinase)